MKFDYVFIAIMFPAIPLMMSVFSNRFHTLSVLIRSMHDQYKYKKQYKWMPLYIQSLIFGNQPQALGKTFKKEG